MDWEISSETQSDPPSRFPSHPRNLVPPRRIGAVSVRPPEKDRSTRGSLGDLRVMKRTRELIVIYVWFIYMDDLCD